MIRVAIVDDHHVVRVGFEAALEAEPDIEAVGVAASAAELEPLLYRTRPDVVIVDYRLADVDGLEVCRRLKREVSPPRVLLHSAFADDWMTVPAILAGVDGVVHKGSPGRELCDAIRTVAAGGSCIPAVRPEFLSACSEALAPEDRAILAMLVHETPEQEIGRVLGLDARQLRGRMDRMLGTLRAVAT